MLINVVTFLSLNTISKVASWLTRVFQKILGLQGKADADREMRLENAMKRCFFYSDKKKLFPFGSVLTWNNLKTVCNELTLVSYWLKNQGELPYFSEKKMLHDSLHDLMTPMGFTHNQLTYYYPMERLPSSSLHTTTPTFSLTLNYINPPLGFRYYHLQPYT